METPPQKDYEVKTTSQEHDTYFLKAANYQEARQLARFSAKRGGYKVLSVRLWRDPLKGL